MKVEAFSNFGLYGNHAVFTEHAKAGCTKVSFGTGPWVQCGLGTFFDEERIVGMFIFFYPRKRVKILATWKGRGAATGWASFRSTRRCSYTATKFKSLMRTQRLRISGQMPLKSILRKWTGGVKSF